MSIPEHLNWVEDREVTAETAAEIAEWCGGKLVEEIGPDNTLWAGINVPATFGVKRASEGDHVIFNVYDEFLVVKASEYNELQQPFNS